MYYPRVKVRERASLADVAESVYALVSKTSPARVEGSSPSIGTSQEIANVLSGVRSSLRRFYFGIDYINVAIM